MITLENCSREPVSKKDTIIVMHLIEVVIHPIDYWARFIAKFSHRRIVLSDRLAVAVAAFVMQMALGSIYAWSVFSTPIMIQYGISRVATNGIFTIALAAVGVTAGFGGFLQRRYGPRLVAVAAGAIYGSGVCLAGLAPNLMILYLTHGLMAGVGVGLGYTIPISIMTSWFPNRIGFATGLAAAGFGMGAIVVSSIAVMMLARMGLRAYLGRA